MAVGVAIDAQMLCNELSIPDFLLMVFECKNLY